MPKITGSLRRWSEGRYGRCERNIQDELTERQALFKFLFFCFEDRKEEREKEKQILKFLKIR